MPRPPAAAPPAGWLQRLLNLRFFLVSLVVLVFLAALFAWGTGKKGPAPLLEPENLQAPPAQEGKALEPPKAIPPEPHQAIPPVKEAPATSPAPTPGGRLPARPPTAAVKPKEPARGETFTRALIKMLDDQVNQTWFGWRPNSIVFGYLGLTDNVNNVQLGVLEVARRTIVVLNETMTRFATTEAYNPQVNEAMNFIMVSPDKYWFPSATGKYREAMRDLDQYAQGLSQGSSRFYTRVDNLISLLSNYKDILGSSFHHLIKDTEADGTPVSWWVTDDYFYVSRGIALGMYQMLDAVKEEFHPELQKKNSQKLLEDAIHALHAASELHPWLVTNAAKDGILANHRANMATFIGEAEQVIATLRTQLATN